LIVALPKPQNRRLVFRPARRVSWATRIFTVLVVLLAIGTTAAFLLVVLPARVADLGRYEANELATARKGAATVNQSLASLWVDISAGANLQLPPDRLAADLAQSKALEKEANDALAHAESAKTYLLEADGIPFQLHAPVFVQQDRPAITQLEAGLNTAIRLAHAATLQMSVAQGAQRDNALVTGQLSGDLARHDWTNAARDASNVQGNLKSDELSAQDPDAMLDPNWGKWLDAMLNYSQTVQSYALASAQGQTQVAQQLGRTLNAQAARISATQLAAQLNAAAYEKANVQPLLDQMSKALSTAS
jgi:hypothetical protein